MGAATRAFVVTLVVFLAFGVALFSWKDAQRQAEPAESVGGGDDASDVANETGMETETNATNATAGADASPQP